MNFDFKHTIALGWPILSILFIFSILSIAIFMQCWAVLRHAKQTIDTQNTNEMPNLLFYFELIEKRLALLGTIASSAPFIGLLGTVIGIIRAFHSISISSGGGGIATVAGGISEALVATAAGLAVAIPATMIFNYFTFKSQQLAKKAGIDL